MKNRYGEDDFVNEIQKTLQSEINEVTANCLKDIMKPAYDKDTTNIITHEIIIRPGSEPIKQKTRGIPHKFREDFKKTLIEMKEAGMIVDSKSPWCSPVRLVRKKDGSVRVCIDYRKLNNLTVKDSYPVPKIEEELFPKLSKANIFTTLDLCSGYYQCKMSEGSREYTAFSCEYGFFEYIVMPQGLTNSGATFQRMMNKVLSDLIGEICLVYLDDIIIYSNSEKDHLEHVRRVLKRLKEFNLKIKLKKCKFAEKKVEYISHIIENGTIRPNPAKINALFKYEIPKSQKQVKAFLGLVSYYRKFIRGCSSIASPLIRSTEKDKDFMWTSECQKAFEELRNHLTTVNDILMLPNFDLPFKIETDASQYGIGGVLSQQYGKNWKPVAYFSKHLNRIEFFNILS